MPQTVINPLNRLEYSNRQGYSKFDLGRPYPTTLRFAQLTPFFLERAILGDRFKIQVSQKLVNYVTLKSPLMGDVRFHNDFFAVPKEAMMPHTYELLFRNPNKGDDVPDDAYPYFDLRNFVSGLLAGINVRINADNQDEPAQDVLFKSLVLLYHMCGYGTLPDFFDDRSCAHVGAATQYIHETANMADNVASFGWFFDRYWSSVFGAADNNYRDVNAFDAQGKLLFSFHIDGPQALRSMFTFLVDYEGYWTIDLPEGEPQASSLLKNSDIKGSIESFYTYFSKYQSYGVDDILPYVAYQMIYSQFFSVDTVDNVFDYKLWRMNMEGIAHGITGSLGTDVTYPMYFDYNGIQYQYDLFSNRVMEALSTNFRYHMAQDAVAGSTSDQFFACYSFFMNLFAMRNTLRHLDYFAGSRTRPLAVGDVTAPVVENGVSAIDTTKSISMQRFLNAVNRARQQMSGYAKSIFGVDVPRDSNSPRALSSEVFNVTDIVNINTAENQGERRSNIDSTGSRFAFEMEFNQECYVIGLSYFDYILTNPYSVNRFNFHKDRFDDFQPMLQDIGDQPIYLAELQGVVPTSVARDKVFGYQLQDAEYKFPVATCHGGVVNHLPSWFFVDYMNWQKENIDSDYLRLKPYYFDRYFSQLSGMSPESYFHFIVSYMIKFESHRKMQFKPGILQQ